MVNAPSNQAHLLLYVKFESHVDGGASTSAETSYLLACIHTELWKLWHKNVGHAFEVIIELTYLPYLLAQLNAWFPQCIECSIAETIFFY